jgi:hypothetical protein
MLDGTKFSLLRIHFALVYVCQVLRVANDASRTSGKLEMCMQSVIKFLPISMILKDSAGSFARQSSFYALNGASNAPECF